MDKYFVQTDSDYPFVIFKLLQTVLPHLKLYDYNTYKYFTCSNNMQKTENTH